MKAKVLVFILSSILSLNSHAAEFDFTKFLKSAGYGALIGAGVGVVSLALENKPSQHYANVARGASLGLYGGLIYGAIQVPANQPKRVYEEPDFATNTLISPKISDGSLAGVEVNSIVYNF